MPSPPRAVMTLLPLLIPGGISDVHFAVSLEPSARPFGERPLNCRGHSRVSSGGPSMLCLVVVNFRSATPLAPTSSMRYLPTRSTRSERQQLLHHRLPTCRVRLVYRCEFSSRPIAARSPKPSAACPTSAARLIQCRRQSLNSSRMTSCHSSSRC
jgi:hypothetical protein